KPLYEERRPFIGTWRLVSPSPLSPDQPTLIWEIDLRSDGTFMKRLWDSQTGVVRLNERSPSRWYVANGRFREITSGFSLLHDLVGVGGRSAVRLDSPVTWEGPDRFSLEARFLEHSTLTFSRCESVSGLPRTRLPIGPE